MRKLLALIMTTLFAVSGAVNVSSALQLERPTRTVEAINQRDDNLGIGSEGAVGIGAEIVEYREGPNTPSPYYGHDGLRFRLIATSNVRKGIEYEYFTLPNINGLWYEVNTPTGLGDDSVCLLSLPFDVTFYGGPGVQNSSAVYNKIWVSSNGFVSFGDVAPPSSPNPISIPSPFGPNAIVAAFWFDLWPTGGESTITYGDTLLGFTVEWKNVLNKLDGSLLTFQIVFSRSHWPGYRGQNIIYLLYRTVTWPNYYVVRVGIEDQEGHRGVVPPHVNSWQGIEFRAKSSSPEIRNLNILMNKNDANAELYFSTERWSKKGQNTRWTTPQPETPSTAYLSKALYGAGTLLISSIPTNPAVGFMCGTVLLTLELGLDYYEQNWESRLREADVKIRDEYSNPGTDFAYLNATAATDYYGLDHPVDASVGTEIYWIFLDDDSLDHELTLTAQLQLYSPTQGKIIALETSITLRVIIGTPSIPARPTGSSYAYVDLDYSCFTNATTPDYDSVYYQFDWGDGSNTTIGPYGSGWDVSASHRWDGTGTYYVRVRAKDYSYERWSDWSQSLAVSVFAPGGCPWVSAWNRTQYVFDNNLIPAAEHSNGTDVVDYYSLQQPIARDEGKYSLLISDTDKHSFLDQVQLLAVDHKADVNVAVSPYGEILTYRNPTSPVMAISQDGENLTNILGAIDGQYYEGSKDDYVTLDFGNLNTSNGAKLVLRTDPWCEPNPCKESIHVQVSNETGYWSEVARFIPRIYWATDIINLSSCLPDANGDLKVRLYLTANHRIDYVGLDTSAQAKTEQQYANLATASHSRLGDVKELFRNSDNLRVELLPGEHVTLQFTEPQLKEEKRDFIIILEGHYFLVG